MLLLKEKCTVPICELYSRTNTYKISYNDLLNTPLHCLEHLKVLTFTLVVHILSKSSLYEPRMNRT